MSYILGTWLNEYSRDFTEPPDFPCLKKLVAYLKFNMPGSEEERHAKLLLVHLEHLVSSEEKSEGEEPGENTDHRKSSLCWAPQYGSSKAAIGPGERERQGSHRQCDRVWQGILLGASVAGNRVFFLVCFIFSAFGKAQQGNLSLPASLHLQ
jgi:hypothetical protein